MVTRGICSDPPHPGWESARVLETPEPCPGAEGDLLREIARGLRTPYAAGEERRNNRTAVLVKKCPKGVVVSPSCVPHEQLDRVPFRGIRHLSSIRDLRSSRRSAWCHPTPAQWPTTPTARPRTHPLTLPCPGVLGNDYDADGDQLTHPLSMVRTTGPPRSIPTVRSSIPQPAAFSGPTRSPIARRTRRPTPPRQWSR